jgi:hypothetical protein
VVCRKRQPHETVPRIAGGENQRPHHPTSPGVRIEDQPHPPEIDLALVARFAIRDAHGRALPSRATAHLRDVTLHRTARHHDPATLEQLPDLHRGQIVLHPRGDLVVLHAQQPPRLTTAVRAMRAHRFHHPADELVAELLDATPTDEPQPFRGTHVTADRLAVQPDQPLDRADPLARQPQAQHHTNLEHTHLPERHRRLPIAR